MEKADNEKKYDFDFVCSSLGLLRISGGAINPGAIVDITVGDLGRHIIHLHGGESWGLMDEEMARLEAAIRLRKEEARAAQKEAMRQQFQDQQEAMIAVQQGIASPILVPTNRRRQ